MEVEKIDIIEKEKIKGGYRIKLSDGNSMCILETIITQTPKSIQQLNFGQAIEALKNGQRVARQGWNGKDMYLYLVKATELQSGLKYGYGEYQGEPQFVDVICMKTAQNTLVVGWLASQTDMLSDDWVIVE